MMHILYINLITILALAGFSIASYIYIKKRKKKKMICPMHSNCETVIHSDYSKILGIPVELLGMLYYASIGIAYTYVSITSVWSPQIAMVLLGASGCSLLFSIYLVSLQVFVIKHLCTWCLLSGVISFLIFLFSYLHLFV